MFLKRIGPDPHENGALTVGCRGCPDIWELENGDFAVIGIDITDVAIPKLPPTAGCGPDERIVLLPRNLFSSAGIIGGLWFTAVSLHSETKTRRIANLLTLTANYREIWKEFFRSPELARVIEPSANVAKKPVTPAEEFFVHMIISHTSSVYEALKDELLTKQEGLRRDVRSFFSLPVPKAVWIKTKLLQNHDFAAFIESSLK